MTAKEKIDAIVFPDQSPKKNNCAHCNKEIMESPYDILCRAITQHKPVCSYECNKALGQLI
jgi:hypothetical protein